MFRKRLNEIRNSMDSIPEGGTRADERRWMLLCVEYYMTVFLKGVMYSIMFILLFTGLHGLTSHSTLPLWDNSLLGYAYSSIIAYFATRGIIDERD